MKFKKNKTRREFIKSCARYLSLGGLSVLGISLSWKGIAGETDSSCEVNLPCRNCFKLGRCSEDKAIEMREEINSKVAENSSIGESNG